jgi:hypothetical protein
MEKMFKSDILNSAPLSLSNMNIGWLTPRTMSSGSVGFNYGGKTLLTIGEETVKLQVSLNVTLCHSKPGDTKRVDQDKIDRCLALGSKSLKDFGLNNACAEARSFSSGKVGYYYGGKVMLDGLLFQVGLNVVAVGSDQLDAVRPVERPNM